MSPQKITAGKSGESASAQASRSGRTSTTSKGGPPVSRVMMIQQPLCNQAMLELLESGGIQTKMRVSQPGDPDEQEADRAADQVLAATHPPKIQRKCACEGTGKPCAKCEDEETGTIHRSVASPSLRSSQLAVQRAPASDASAKSPDQAGSPPKPSPTPAHTHPLVVEDDAKSVSPLQMRKSAFIALLRSDACATADAVLLSVGHTTKSCPYIEKWLAFYEKQSADHIERAILKYAPETAHARSAHEAIRLVVMRVQRAAMTWAKTGKVTGLPDDLASQLPGQGFLGAVHSFASSTVGGAILGFLGGSKTEKSASDTPADKSPAASVSRKPSDGHSSVAPAHDPQAVRSQLGAGHSLDSKTHSQMSSAFGRDFSSVRIHTDAQASSLSSNLNARAFTIGSDVAFASGEYRPGTPVGDALIAHELAHVVQQSASLHSSSPMQKSADGAPSATGHAASQLESDADLSAVGAVASIWAGAKRGLADLRANAIPRLRSGLRLQRCDILFGSSKGDKAEDAGAKVEPGPTADAATAGDQATACAQRSTNCTNTDDPNKIVCDHKAAPDTIQQPGDTVNITAKFACKVRGWVSILEKSDGTSLSLNEPKTENTNNFSRSWNGKKLFGSGSAAIGQFLVDDGDYRHRFDKLLYAFKPVSKKKSDDLFATGPALVSNPIHVRARTFTGGKPEHFHYTKDNIADLGDIIYSEVGIAGDDEKKAVAWAVRNQMLRIGTAKVGEAADFFHDSRLQHTKVDPKDGPAEVARKNKSAALADEILKKPMSDDITSGAVKWFSPDSMPQKGQSCAGKDCRGGLITVKDRSGTDTRVYSPSWTKTMTKVTVNGVDDWRLMLYKL